MQLPDLTIANWKPTRDSLQQCAQLLGKVRAAASPKEKHWFHITLHCGVSGLTTGPMVQDGRRLALELDFRVGEIVLRIDQNQPQTIAVDQVSIVTLSDWLVDRLAAVQVAVPFDRSALQSRVPLSFRATDGALFWTALSEIDSVFRRFRGRLREETGPVQLWPHHFDLAMLWFSGNLIAGADPADAENADEQMNFGFVPGDESIPEPYFYITAYPSPDGLTKISLHDGAYWHTDGFTGAILPYSDWRKTDDPATALLGFLETVQSHGASLMRRATKGTSD